MCEFCGLKPAQLQVTCTTPYGGSTFHRVCILCQTRSCPFGHYRN